jgi:hypothetical protein
MKQPEIVIDLVKAEMRAINHFSLGGKSLEQERDYNTLATWLYDAESDLTPQPKCTEGLNGRGTTWL